MLLDANLLHFTLFVIIVMLTVHFLLHNISQVLLIVKCFVVQTLENPCDNVMSIYAWLLICTTLICNTTCILYLIPLYQFNVINEKLPTHESTE